MTPRGLVRRCGPALRPEGGSRWLQSLAPHRLGETPAGAVLGRLGSLEVRLARTAGEIRAAQKLRYHVFYEEKSAMPSGATALQRRDRDEFDAVCDHVLVLDHETPAEAFRPKPRVVGTYRLLRQEVAELNFGFYTASEFDIQGLVEAKSPPLRFMELGRSCVLKSYRNKRTIELLWHGVWSYVLMHRVDVMIGCASLEGTDPDHLALPLSFLHHHALAPEEWRVRALPRRYVSMERMPKEAVDVRAALHALPPLVKGYLRLGAFIGDGAVIDRQFGTTDVCMVLPVSGISQRYVNYYGADASRHAS